MASMDKPIDAHIPRCAHKGKRRVCGKPAMPNTQECFRHWQKARGWNPVTLQYEEDLPFAAPVSDEDYAGDAMYAGTQG